MVTVTKVKVSYELNTSLPMSIKGINFNSQFLANARYIFPLDLPFEANHVENDNYTFRFSDKQESFVNQIVSLSDLVSKWFGFVKERYPTLTFKRISLDSSLIPIVATTNDNIVYGIAPANYFDIGKFLISTHISKTVADCNVSKSAYGVIKFGDCTYIGFNSYTLCNIIIPYLLNYLYLRYGNPEQNKDIITPDSFLFLYSMLCAQLNYDRVFKTSVDVSYEALKASGSLPTVNTGDISKDSEKFIPYAATLLNLYNRKVNKSAVVVKDNEDYGNDDWSEKCVMYGNKVPAVLDEKSVEPFFEWDVHDLYDLFTRGYIESGVIPEYCFMPINDFLDISDFNGEFLADFDKEVVMLTSQDIRIRLKKRYVLSISRNDIIVGFYVEDRLIIIFSDKYKISKEIEKDFVEIYKYMFSSIEFYNESDVDQREETKL